MRSSSRPLYKIFESTREGGIDDVAVDKIISLGYYISSVVVQYLTQKL